MAELAGPSGPLHDRFEDGLRFLATALALRVDHRNEGAAITAACDAVRCFLEIFQAAADQHLPDPDGNLMRLRNQCIALLTPCQDVEDALQHAMEAAKLARDEAARLVLVMMAEKRENTPEDESY